MGKLRSRGWPAEIAAAIPAGQREYAGICSLIKGLFMVLHRPHWRWHIAGACNNYWCVNRVDCWHHVQHMMFGTVA